MTKQKIKNNFYILVCTIVILIGCIGNENRVYCQSTNQEVLSPKRVQLTQGCQLLLGPGLKLDDSIAGEIIKGIQKILPRIQNVIPADNVTIDLAINRGYILPEAGVGGQANSSQNVWISFDPKNPNYKVEYLIQGLSHELHHAARLRMPRWHMSLLELMIMEGLADHFMNEIFNCSQPARSRALTEKEIRKVMIRLKPQIRNKLESWEACIPWMFGRGGDEPIPQWTGYTIGWKIVENYLNAHPDAKASSLFLTPSETIISATPELKHGVQKANNQIKSMDNSLKKMGSYGSFKDPRNGKTYKTIQIGNQIWMAENLDYQTENGSWLYDNNTINASYGRLYNWRTACTVCPDGWHLPSDEEWKQLEMFLKMNKSDADNFGLRGNHVGIKLKSTGGWKAGGKVTNESKFSALTGGYRFTSGDFYDMGYNAYFWTSTPFNGERAWFRSLGYENGDVGRNITLKSFGFSIRCFRAHEAL